MKKVLNLEEILAYKKQLKSISKKLITNCIISDDDIEEYIMAGDLFAEYKKNKYLNLLYFTKSLYRLYYYIADINGYDLNFEHRPVVCEIFTKAKDECFLKIENVLETKKFEGYASYQKMSVRSGDLIESVHVANINYDCEAREMFVRKLAQYFNEYSDHVPIESRILKFMEEKKFINIYNNPQDKTHMGSLIFSRQGNVFTEEFIYIENEYRGRGLAQKLHDLYYKMNRSDKSKFVAWVRSDNVSSIHLHEKYGYQNEKLMKYTFILKEDN